MRTARPGPLRAFVVDARGSAGIELALGAVVLLGVAGLCFALYSRVEADTAGARVAATLADYVSRGPDTAGGALDGAGLKALGAFLHAHELAGADLVLVVSALRPGAGAPKPEVLWSDDTLRYGDAKVTEALAGGCSRFVRTPEGAASATAAKPLPGGFTPAAGEVVAVVELCARPGGVAGPFAGDIYRHHVLPVREPEKAFPAPVHARSDARAAPAEA